VLLCHGFGASARTFRRTIPALAAAGHKVYAIDLLGFGASEKPVREYTIELWAELVADFVREFELGGGVGGSGVSVDGVSSGSGSSGGDGDGSGSDSSGGGVVLVGNSIGSLVCLTVRAVRRGGMWGVCVYGGCVGFF
jgi:pimeloyl-ACP methyl ester carboxylesterase